jgi:uncharacterized protein (DUF1501 family)
MTMDRRRFLKTTAAAGAVSLGSGRLAAAFGAADPFSAALAKSAAANDRVLVVVRLDGGNDGLNTVLPLSQYDNLAKARSNVLIPAAKALALDAATGFHPAMSALHTAYQEGKVKVVQAVGYPNHNQSHFRSTDIWFTASDSNQVLDSGFLGRYLDGLYPGYPEGYPRAEHPDPPAVQIGSVLVTLLQGANVGMGMAISNPSNIYSVLPEGIDTAPSTPAGHELTFLRQMASQTQKYGESIKKAVAAATNKSTLYPATGNRLADQLKAVARLIAGGLKSRIYVVSIGGFDTHASQVDAIDVTAGKHADLLRQLGDAIAAFQDDLRLLGLEDRVVGLTVSEFGRRILSNASLGTDHGTSSPLLLFGKPVAGGILGVNPAIPVAVTAKDNIPMQHDFRSVYATLLKDWLQVDDAGVKRILFKDFPTLPLFGAPQSVHPSAAAPAGFALDQNYPNPFRGLTTVRYSVPEGAQVSLRLYDMRGVEVRVLAQGPHGAGRHQKTLDAGSLSPGRYFYRLRMGDRTLQRTLDVLR